MKLCNLVGFVIAAGAVCARRWRTSEYGLRRCERRERWPILNTRYGGVSTSAFYGNPTTAYSEVAWLTTQFANHTNDFVSLQYAIWDIMNPGSEPTGYGDVQMWLNQAQLNFGSIDPRNFEVVTNTGNLQLTGQVQEFIMQTPGQACWHC